MSLDFQEVFGPDGFFASHFDGYEIRRGQVALSSLVNKAITGGKHCIGEAPCGTGKGVAYGVPAVWHVAHGAGQVVIATANIALQTQLVQKDLPTLQKVLPWPFSFDLLKGKANYLCIDRFKDAVPDGDVFREAYQDNNPFSDLKSETQVSDMKHVVNWGRSVLEHELRRLVGECEGPVHGDKEELPFVPDKEVWSKVSATYKQCDGIDCPFYDVCIARKAQAQAREAQIVVTNYHMLFANALVRRSSGEDLVLPEHDILLCDEAHEIPEIAREFFGWSLTRRAAEMAANKARPFVGDALGAEMALVARELFTRIDRYQSRNNKEIRFKRNNFVDAAEMMRVCGAVTKKLNRAIDDIAAKTRAHREAADEAADEGAPAPDKPQGVGGRTMFEMRRALRQVSDVERRLKAVLSLEDSNMVYWLERKKFKKAGYVAIKAKPIVVNDVIRKEVFGCTGSVSLVSATLATGGNFEFIRKEIGAPTDALMQIVSSPFDFQKQAAMVVPMSDLLPEPNNEAFPQKAALVVEDVIRRSRGRTLGLFTSYRVLNVVADSLRDSEFDVMVQGDAPRLELVRRFKENTNSVLLGTKSFWTGIDVVGEALTTVIIDRIPFDNPKDPILDALKAQSSRSFYDYSIPKATIELRQAVGRLIRSRQDYGVVVLLDSRLSSKQYGNRIVNSLPDMPVYRRIKHISFFLDKHR